MTTIPGLTVTLADIPQVVERFRNRNRDIHAVEADLFDSESWPIGPDCHLLANVLHDWINIDDILSASCHALKQSAKADAGSAGRLIIIEQLLADNKAGPLPAALASVSMLLGDWRTGKQYSFAELQLAAQRAGFSTVELGPSCGDFHTAIICHV